MALAQALAERRIAGAAVDVFAQEPPPAGHPLYKVDNVIVVLRDGQIVEQGTFDSLLANPGVFASLWRMAEGVPAGPAVAVP